MGKATLVVDGVTYEGVVRLLPNGAMEAMGDFHPVSETGPEFKSAYDLANLKAIRHSWAVFWADAEKSGKILDPEWLDIGHVSVATAYHPKCGRVTFIAYPQQPSGDGDGRIVKTYSLGLNWQDRSVVSLHYAKHLIAEYWATFCKSHEKPSVLWTQVTDQILVGECGGWQCAITPSSLGANTPSLAAWMTDKPCDPYVATCTSIEVAKRTFVNKAHGKFSETC